MVNCYVEIIETPSLNWTDVGPWSDRVERSARLIPPWDQAARLGFLRAACSHRARWEIGGLPDTEATWNVKRSKERSYLQYFLQIGIVEAID